MIVCCWFSCVDLEYFKFPDDKSSYFLQFLSVFFSRCSGHTHSCHHSLTLTHTFTLVLTATRWLRNIFVHNLRIHSNV